MDLTSMPWGSFRGPACILWWIYKCSGELPRVPRRPHASTQRRRRVAAVQACLGRCSKRLRAASAPNAATHPPHEHDSLAEWSKALASGASPKGRGFESHRCHGMPMNISECILLKDPPTRNRTRDHLIYSQMLYQLSYRRLISRCRNLLEAYSLAETSFFKVQTNRK